MIDWRTGLLLLAAVTLLACGNLPWHLDDKDQAKQAFTSFEMIEKGNWWFQHTPTGKIATKPPLAGWISSALYLAMGRQGWDYAWRLPGFVCALATLILLWRAGNQLPNAPPGGLLAGSAFAFNHFSGRLSTLVRTDMLLTFFIFAAGLIIYEQVRRGSVWSNRSRVLLGLAITGSLLTKGPIAYAFLVPGLVAFSVFCRKRRLFNPAWSGWWPWLLPLLIFGVWAAIGIWRSPAFYEQVVLVEFLGRFTVGEAAVHHNQPVYFYITNLLVKFAPWSLLLVALACWRTGRELLTGEAGTRWLLCWSLGGLLFMSMVPSKRADRIFPVIPPLCLLVAAAVAPLADRPFRRRSGRELAYGTVLLAVALSTVDTAFGIIQSARDNARGLVRFGKEVRETTASAPDQLAVAASKDEGLLLYTNQPGFLKMNDARSIWDQGELTWLVLNDGDFTKNAAALEPFQVRSQVARLPGKFSGYRLLERVKSAAPASAPRASSDVPVQ